MRIAITGSGGFLGTTLAEYLLDNTEHELLLLTSQVEKTGKKHSGKRIIVFSNENLEIFRAIKIDILINCAFPRNADGVQMASGLKYISDVLSAAVEGNVSAVINISSQSVYSLQRIEPASEQTMLVLENGYAVGKYAAELMTNTICNGIPHTNIRMASLVGAGFEQRITNKFISLALEGKKLHIVGGKQRFGFLDVRDAVKALSLLLDSNYRKWEEKYNLGGGESYTLEYIARTVCELSNEYCQKPVNYEVEEADVWQNSALNAAKFRETFRWEPIYALRDTLKSIYDYKIERRLSER